MRITHDPGADALSIELRPVQPQDSIDLEDGVTADLGAEGHLVGIEVLDASERLGADALASVAIERLPVSPSA